MKLRYKLSKDWIAAEFVRTGVAPSWLASVTLDPALLTADHRAHLVRVTGEPVVPEIYELRTFTPSWDLKPVKSSHWFIELSAPATDAEALALFEDDMARYEACLVECEAKRVAKAEADEQERVRREAEAAKAQAQAIAEAQAKAAREADKAAWIAASGSEHLRKAFTAGYDCQRLYVTERAAAEYPGFAVDFEDKAAWKARSCPSEQALELAERHSGRVVWLTRPGYELSYEEYWGEREAVVIEDFLGRYDLVMEVA